MTYMPIEHIGELFIPNLLPQLGNKDGIELETLTARQLNQRLRRLQIHVPNYELAFAYRVWVNICDTGVLYVLEDNFDVHYRGKVPLAHVNRRRHSLDPRTQNIHLSYTDGARGDVWNEIPFP